MNAADRVAITGIGAVSALGIGFAALRDGLLAGRSGIRPLADVDSARLVARHAGRVPDFAPPSGADSLDRHVQMALVAAAEALADSGLARSGRRVALVFATCAGPLATLETRTAPATPRADDDPEADPDGRIHLWLDAPPHAICEVALGGDHWWAAAPHAVSRFVWTGPGPAPPSQVSGAG